MSNNRILSSVQSVSKALALPIIFIAFWQWFATNFPVDPSTPVPSQVLVSFLDLTREGDLLDATIQSLSRVLLGFCFAAAMGIALGLLMGSFPSVRESLDPIVESFRPIAPMAILPIAILWFGTGTPTALAIVGYASFFPVLVNTIHGVSRVDRKLVLAAKTMDIPSFQILLRVIVPASLPFIILGSRLAMGVAWTAIIAAELAVGAKSGGGTSGGIGQMMFVYFAYNIDFNAIVVCMVVVGVVALLIDRLFRLAERVLMPWRN
jgi:ABC-type nitrate/sulfonate/bicarbonate transport system permease component